MHNKLLLDRMDAKMWIFSTVVLNLSVKIKENYYIKISYILKSYDTLVNTHF